MRLNLFFCIFLLAQRSVAQTPFTPNYDESKVGSYTLPDPLRLPNGKRITTAKQWENEQRGAILTLFKQQVYGEMPGRVPGTRYEVQRVDSSILGGKATRKFVRIWFGAGTDVPYVDAMLYLPKAVRKAPVFVTLNYGNYTTSDDPTIPLSGRVNSTPDSQAPKRGSFARRWPYEQLIDAGFGIITADYGDLEPDKLSGWKTGIRTTLQAQTTLKPEQWSAIGAWAWGMSRLADYLETEPTVDAKRLIVQGHSRLGKTALWAGANDPRFAMVVSNESGEGGAALARRNYGETVKRVTEVFPYWFIPTYATYSERVNELPIDQHELLALMAPRVLYVCSAAEDNWSDQRGEFLSLKAAAPVWGLYGPTPTLGEFPVVDQPVRSGPLGYHNRAGKHDVMPFDWAQYIAHAKAAGLTH